MQTLLPQALKVNVWLRGRTCSLAAARMGRRLASWAKAGCAGLLVLWAVAAPCAAESRIDVPYSRAEVWQALQRFCAVDLEGEIATADQEAGFLVFTFPHAAGPQRGSFEVFTPARGSTPVLVLRLSQLPSYMERLYLKKVLAKLERQLGPPLRPRATAPAAADGAKETPPDGAATKE